MRISIIIACLNSEAVIGRCLESIVRQDYDDIEVVIADGASNDGTTRIIREFEAALAGKLIWFSAPDRGIADAWNKAVAKISGDWVLFLGADDALASPDVMSRVSGILATADPKYRVVYGQVALVTPNGRVADHIDRPWSPAEYRSCRAALPHQAVFHHSSLFRDHGPFDTSYRITCDYDFLLRELMHAEPLYLPSLTVTNMQIGGLSTNRRYATRVVREEQRVFRSHTGRISYVHLWRLAKCWGIELLYWLGGDRLALSVSNIYRRLAGGQPPLQY
jgi:glycosyltransferase involved in cell wall biosynthesis